MDDLDRKILHSLQYDFPLKKRPFEILARQLGIDAKLFPMKRVFKLDARFNARRGRTGRMKVGSRR